MEDKNLQNISEEESCKEGSVIKMLDIGTGATVIYPLLAFQMFEWNCIGLENHQLSYEEAYKIIEKNGLCGRSKIELFYTGQREEEDGIKQE